MESQIPVVDTRPDRSKSYDPPKPILDRLLVRRLAAEEQTGFAIPEKYRQHTNRGTVIAIGDGVMLGVDWVCMEDFVKPGDIVKYGEYTAERFGPDDDELYIIRLQDVRTVERVRE
jgi:co-chaperonin GroES (HSP10)